MAQSERERYQSTRSVGVLSKLGSQPDDCWLQRSLTYTHMHTYTEDTQSTVRVRFHSVSALFVVCVCVSLFFIILFNDATGHVFWQVTAREVGQPANKVACLKKTVASVCVCIYSSTGLCSCNYVNIFGTGNINPFLSHVQNCVTLALNYAFLRGSCKQR